MERIPKRIGVNAISPAVMRTPIREGFIPKTEVDSELQSFNRLHPVGRAGTVPDVPEVVRFLLWDKADWGTGAIGHVDRGLMPAAIEVWQAGAPRAYLHRLQPFASQGGILKAGRHHADSCIIEPA